MAKKAAKTNTVSSDAAASAPKKTTVSRVKKHVKAQVAGIAAAVEGFVETMTAPAESQNVESPKVAAEQPVAHEAISKLAYKLYLERGGANGDAASDWLRAERALRAASSV